MCRVQETPARGIGTLGKHQCKVTPVILHGVVSPDLPPEAHKHASQGGARRAPCSGFRVSRFNFPGCEFRISVSGLRERVPPQQASAQSPFPFGAPSPHACWCSGLEVQGLGFRVWVSGFGVQGLGFRVWGSGSGFQDSKFGVWRPCEDGKGAEGFGV